MSRPFCCATPPDKALDTDSWDPAGGIKDGRKKKKKRREDNETTSRSILERQRDGMVNKMKVD